MSAQVKLELPPAFTRAELDAFREWLADSSACFRRQANELRRGPDYGPVGREMLRNAHKLDRIAKRMEG